MNPTNFENFEKVTRINVACAKIFKNQKDIDSMKELQLLINNTSSTVLKTVEPIIFGSFFQILESISKRTHSFKTQEKQQLVDTLTSLFKKVTIDKLPLFFNIYGFLLFEIYDHINHKIMNIDEEYKLSIVECVTSLVKCLNASVFESLYVKKNVPQFSQMIYVLLELTKQEKLKTLRISAINCIMALAHVLDDNDFNDLVTRNQVAEVFFFFLPGVALQLHSVALIDEKYGHKIPSVALKAWGRLVTLLMQDYGAHDQKIKLNVTSSSSDQGVKPQWKDENEFRSYIHQTLRTAEWYKENDKKLQQVIIGFSKLTHHSHYKVRLELANMVSLLVENCIQTLPTSISHLVDLVIVLSSDSDASVAAKSKDILDNLSEQLTSSDFKSLLDNLEEGFYGVMGTIPRKFNGIDEREQLAALNCLTGYLSLFGKHNLTNVLHSTVHLNKLILTLMHISEFDKSGVSILEEYVTSDYDVHHSFKTPWKKFRHFKDDSLLHKIEGVCHLLAQFGASSIISNFLLDIIISNSEQKKEATFLLNAVITGLEINNENINIVKNVINTFTDRSNWYLPLVVGVDDNGYEYTLSDIQDNIIQVCLLTEGIGKIAVSLKEKFGQFMLKTLYLVLERAGSANYFIWSAGSLALTDISAACGYPSITYLINANIDYFSFHIERKLSRRYDTVGGLNVLTVVMRYSSKEVLNSTCEVIKELLMESYNMQKTNLNDYLHVFRMFIHSLHRWLDIKQEVEVFKTKKEKQETFEHFQVSNIDETMAKEDFSDEIMGTSAEDMYKEDMEKQREELENEVYEPQEYKKPEPPIYIKLTVSILTNSLHSLPSKNQARKLLVLEILKDGLPVLKEWEDELLPIVHQIWSPLVDRFKETSDPLIINYSFQLLVVLARLSKDFIRSRTTKEVLPYILTVLNNLAKESYLKDKGSAYRYSQNYKLQMTILGQLARVLTDLDVLQCDFDKAMVVVFNYLSDKQPVPLQKAAIEFFVHLYNFDPEPTDTKVQHLSADSGNEYSKNIEHFWNLTRHCE